MSGVAGSTAVDRGAAVRAEHTRILSTMLNDVRELAGRAVTAIRTEISAYATLDPATHADVHDQVLAHYRTMLAAILEGRPITHDDISFTRRAAMRRARAGITLTDYVSAFRVGRQVLWETVVACAGDSAEGHEAALSIATPLMHHCDVAGTHAADAYVEFQRYTAAEAVRQSRDLLEMLLTGQQPARGPLAGMARRFGLCRNAPMVVVVALPLGPESGLDAQYAASAAIGRTTANGSRTFSVVRQSEIVAMPVLGPDGDPRPLCDELQRVRQRLLDEGIVLAMGVSTVLRGVSGIARAYREARAVIDFLPEDGGIAALPRLTPLEYLTLCADDTARHLVDPRIDSLLAEDRERGGTLTATIRAFAAADLNLRAAAERLRIHHNTAHYRLRRVEERTGHSPRHLSDLVDLLVAIALRDGPAAQDLLPPGEPGGHSR